MTETTPTTTTTTTTPRGPETMNTTTTTTTTTTPAPTASRWAESVDALRGLRDGADRWTLADALLGEVGQGEARRLFGAIAREAEGAGVKPLSVSAMRQYRDTAARFPEVSRVEGVSFSAHRAALASADPERILSDLARANGPAKVTVKNVRDAVALSNGTTPPSAAKSRAARSSSLAVASAEDLGRALADLAGSDAKRTAKSLGQLSPTDLARIADAVTAATSANAATSAKRAAWGTPSPTPSAPTTSAPTPAVSATVAPSAGGGSDLRGL